MDKIRLYFIPFIFTLGAFLLWLEFRTQEFSGLWLAIVILILAHQLGSYLKRRSMADGTMEQ